MIEHLAEVTASSGRRRVGPSVVPSRSVPAAARSREYTAPSSVAAPTEEDGDVAFRGAPSLAASEAPQRASGPQFAAQGPAAPAMMRPPELAPDPMSPPTPEAEATTPSPTPADSTPKWFDNLRWGVFADVYANVNYNFPQPQSGTNFGRTMETTNGFAIAWLGADAAFEGEQAGAVVNLRFGPGAANYAGPDNGSFLQNVKQGYAYWKPKMAKGKLSLDMGKFDSPFGLEVGDSYLNMHYTRPILYNLGQPFFHTGLRVKATLTPMLGLNLFAVNGWNNSVDNNAGKSFGAQLALTPHPKIGMYLGYLGGPENGERTTVACDAGTAFNARSGACEASTGAAASETQVSVRHENRVMRHLVDFVATVTPTDKLSFGLNGDFVYDRVIVNPVSGATDRSIWAGGFLSARYAFTERWALAGRGEFFEDLDGTLTATGVPTMIGTGTVNIDFAPVKFALIRLEQRVDHSNRMLYQRGPSGAAQTMMTTTLGVVVKSF